MEFWLLQDLTDIQTPFTLLLIWLLLSNLAGAVLSALDKIAAGRGWRRVPEKSFIILAFIGGGFGVLLSFYAVRHKTRHKKLLLWVWLGTLLSFILLWWLLYWLMP